ncbi:MAG: TolC family protein [Planctomycetota bacterium]
MLVPKNWTPLIAAALMALISVVAGCRCPSCKCVPPTPVAPCSFERVAPDTSAPDLAALLPADTPSPADYPCLLPAPTESYEALDASACQCNAATNADVANAVQIERHWANVLISCEEGVVEESLCLTRSLLSLQAADLRNGAAAAALTAFYLLAGVEAQQDVLDRGVSEALATLRRIDDLTGQGLPVPDQLDRGVIAAQVATLKDKRLQLCFARIQLNGQLKRLLGCPLDERTFFWPRAAWAPDLTPVDVEGAVAEGLAQRSDVRSLGIVRCKLSKATVPVARKVLAVADATLGAVVPASGLLHQFRCGDCEDHEIAVRCRQLRLIENYNTELAIAKIKSAAFKVGVQQDRVRLAKQAVDERRWELESLVKRREAEDISIFEVSAARGRLYDAETSLIEKVVELKVARVALHEVQGRLAVECGYAVTICGEHCCTGNCTTGPWAGCCGAACSESTCCDAVTP